MTRCLLAALLGLGVGFVAALASFLWANDYHIRTWKKETR